MNPSCCAHFRPTCVANQGDAVTHCYPENCTVGVVSCGPNAICFNGACDSPLSVEWLFVAIFAIGLLSIAGLIASFCYYEGKNKHGVVFVVSAAKDFEMKKNRPPQL